MERSVDLKPRLNCWRRFKRTTVGWIRVCGGGVQQIICVGLIFPHADYGKPTHVSSSCGTLSQAGRLPILIGESPRHRRMLLRLGRDQK